MGLGSREEERAPYGTDRTGAAPQGEVRASDSMPFPQSMGEVINLIPPVLEGLARVVQHEGRSPLKDVRLSIDWEYSQLEFTATACECSSASEAGEESGRDQEA